MLKKIPVNHCASVGATRLVIWRDAHALIKGPSYSLGTHCGLHFRWHSCHEIRISARTNFRNIVGKLLARSGVPETDFSLPGHSGTLKSRNHTAVSPSVCAGFTFICGDAPRTEQRQTPNTRPRHQPNATTPPARLHGASKKKSTKKRHTTGKRGRGGRRGGIFLLNNSSFGQHEARRRWETICIVVRPLDGKRAHVMRRAGGGSKWGVRSLLVWGGGQPAEGRRGGGVKRKSLQSQKPPQVNPHCRSEW